MSTHSIIGKEYSDGSVNFIYCHFDGYPSYVGNILLKKYNNDVRIDRLISRGDLINIGETFSECEYDSGVVMTSKVNCIEDIDNIDFGQRYEYLFRNKDKKWYYRSVEYSNWCLLTKEEC